MDVLAVMDDVSPPVVLRRAVLDDVPGLVALLADDHLGSAREAAERDAAALEPYQRAFRAIDADRAHLLVAACAEQRLVGTMQLSFIPGLSRRGALRAQI